MGRKQLQIVLSQMFEGLSQNAQRVVIPDASALCTPHAHKFEPNGKISHAHFWVALIFSFWC